MKRIIYIILGIFTLSVNFENIYLVYAQLDDNFGNEPEIQMEEDEDALNGESDGDNGNNLDKNEDKSNTDEVEPEGASEISSSVLEDNNTIEVISTQDILDTQTPETPNNILQTYEISQTEQIIDTSSYGIIRISDPTNPNKGITMQDRNLGATITGAGKNVPDTSYGYYYQRGNNYGFSSNGDIENVHYSQTNINALDFGPDYPYSNDIFIRGNSDWSHTGNNNLRGGSGDNINNGRGYPLDNAKERQGPCSSGYHVPSIGEWSKLLELRAYESNGTLTTNSNNLNSVKNNIHDKISYQKRFNIPLADKIHFSNMNREYLNSEAYLWSSSPDNLAEAFRFGGLSITTSATEDSNRSFGIPIRCFLNSYRLPRIITYKTNGGYWSGSDNSDEKSIIYTSDNGVEYVPSKDLGDIKRDTDCGENGDKKCMFAGWYTLTGDELWTGNITEDITVYAKWLPFEDMNIALSGVNFTIMDRNLGSVNSGTGENEYGYYLTGGEDDIKCPEGYHIPSTGEWLGINNNLSSDFNGAYIKNLLNLPFAGKVENNEAIGTGEIGYYLAKDDENYMYAKVDNLGIKIENSEEGEKVSARCFKDYHTGTIIFNTNGGNNIENITAVNWWEGGEDLQTPNREYSNFLGWYTTDNFEEGSKIEKNINYKNKEQINLYAKWNCQEGYLENGDKCDAIYFGVTWIDGNGEILKTDSVKRGDIPKYNGSTPTKNSTPDYKYIFNNKWFPEISVITGDIEYIAQFDEEIIKRSDGGGSGGGGRRSSTINDHGSADSHIKSGTNPIKESSTGEIIIDNIIDNSINNISSGINFEGISLEDISKLQKHYSQEFIDAYIFAKKYGITTVNSIEDAKMYSPLTRIEMAKMLSNFAINVLGKKPDISRGMIKFDDVTNKLNLEYGNTVTIAYQLGIMGQNIESNRFRPNDEVTRAEFVTVLSRLLYGTEDGNGKMKYYEPHILKLYNEGIINKTNPNLKERKGYVMLMLMRNIQ